MRREGLARIDRKRPRQGSNQAEHAVDMDSGASLAVTVQDATLDDPTTLKSTIERTVLNVRGINRDARCAEELSDAALTEWVADKGYHSNGTMGMVAEVGLRSHVSEPQR